MNLKRLSELGHQIFDLSVSTHRNMSVYGDLFSSNLVIGGNGVVNYVIFVTQNVMQSRVTCRRTGIRGLSIRVL